MDIDRKGIHILIFQYGQRLINSTLRLLCILMEGRLSMFLCNTIKITSGLMTHSPGMLGFGASYSINNWNIDLYMRTPYKAVSKGHLQQIGYERRSESRTPRVSDHVISLSVNYRFTFGKKKHKFDNSVIEDTNQSTISRD